MKNTVISIANQKGGVGKTTTTINLSACLAELGKNVLLVDVDPQGNATSGLGVDKENTEKTTYEVMLGSCGIEDAIIKNVYPHLDLLPANTSLAGVEIDLISMDDRELLLRKRLKSVKKDYDFIIFDCPPSLSMITVNAMAASDYVIIPVQCEYYALEGLMQLISTVDLVRERLNGSLDVDGIVFTMADSRNNLSREVVDNVRDNMKEYVYESIIPRNVRLAEAPSYGIPIIEYDWKSAGAEAYRSLAKEVLERHS